MAKNRYDQDEASNQKISFATIKKVVKYFKGYGKTFAIALTFMLIIAFINLLPPYFISIVIDKCLPDRNFVLLIALALILTAAFAIVVKLDSKRALYINTMAGKVIKEIRSDLFTHLQHLPLSYFDSKPHGKILVRVVNYFHEITGLVANGIFDMITNIFKMLIILFFMLSMDVQFTLICIIVLPVFVLLLILIRSNHSKAYRVYSSKQSNLNAYLQESIAGMKITQAFTRESTNQEIFSRLCKENKKAFMKAKIFELTIPMMVTLLSVGTVMTVYSLGVGRINSGNITVGMLLAFVAYVKEFWQPVIMLTSLYNQIVNAGVYFERIFEMMEEPLVIEDAPDAITLTETVGTVDFKNVTFAYESQSPNVLEDISFSVPSGQSVALVGPTGAGKSTIINLLARFYDVNGGKILIDGNDISKVTQSSLRGQMSIMLQDNFLFSGTIMENIRYSKPEATDEEVIEAAKAVCAHDFITQFAEGYNTYINEGGSSLSAGQKQLVAFARALLADPKILILDEATSSIDTETEMALQKGLNHLLEGRTSFIVAHRLSTIKNCDTIMYIDNKNIAEYGTHDELLKKKGKYYSLYMAQFKFLENM